MLGDATLITLAFEPLVAAAKGNARGLVALAEHARQRGDLLRCSQLAQGALELAPDDLEIGYEARAMLARTVPDWHFPMMQDTVRNAAFLGAIERAVRPDMKVLDIGSGSGLLAMMAARAGAQDVQSCEMNPVIAAVAKQIVHQNGFADQVTIQACNSRNIDAEADLGGRADLVISEIIGKDLVCEEVLPSMQDAAKRLAKRDARFIPQGGQIRVALAHYSKMDKYRVGKASGFDLSAFNQLGPARFNVQVNDPALELRGELADLFTFDFASPNPWTDRATRDLVATGGRVDGVVQWLRLQMDETGSFENEPGPDSSRSWALIFFPFAEPIDTKPGDRIGVAASIAKNLLRIWQT